MSWNNHQPNPFWDFIRSMDNTGAAHPGAGVDQPANTGDAPPAWAGGFNTFGGQHPQPAQGHGLFGAPFVGPHPVHQPGYRLFGGPVGGPFAHFGPYGPHHGPSGFGAGFERRGGRGGCGPRGRHCRRNDDAERSGEENDQQARDFSATVENEKFGDPETSVPNEDDASDHPHPHGPPHGPHGPHGPWEGRRGGRRHGHGRGHRGPPPPGFGGFGQFTGPDGTFDFAALMNSLASHPIAQTLRGFAEQAAAAQSGGAAAAAPDADSEDTFTPPIDIFSTPSAYILHIALPGAKKEDVGVNWDADKSELNVAGVVYRAGDEDFLKTLAKSERKVGVFERSVKLPPGAEDKEEVDGDAISAKLEDGVLVVTVPKVEKDWTEVKKVDIE